MTYRFIVTATKTEGHIPKGVIIFDEKLIDNSNSFIIEEGKFIVPSSGNYLFLFGSTAYNTGYSRVKVYVNGNYNDYEFYDANGDSSNRYHQHNFMFASRKLQKDDELWLDNYVSETLYNDPYSPMTFVGYKLIK